MRSPIIALTWEIWRRNAASAGGALAIPLACSLLFPLFAGAIHASGALRFLCYLAMVISLILLFAVFNHTEFNPAKHWTGFPYRQFVLPLSTWRLVAWPMFLGVMSVAAAFVIWARLIFPAIQIRMPLWITVFLVAGMAGYQTSLWSLAAFRIARMLVLAAMANVLVGLALMPIANGESGPGWETLLPLIASVPIGYVIAWLIVSRQRHSGGIQHKWLPWLAEKIGDALPRRTNRFASPAAAQFWFEWRRAGWLLPLSVGALLLTVVAPLSWVSRGDAADSMWVLAWTLASPMILALPVGKGFSKPDFWSRDLALPSFVAIRPITAGELVVTKMKVAALSVAISWLLVVAFLSVWLPLWANLEALGMLRVQYWMAYGHSVYPQYAIAILLLTAGMLLTWRFLVGGLWIGLSGRAKWFISITFVYCAVPISGLIGISILASHDAALRDWVRKDPNQLLACFEWAAAVGVMAKFWWAAHSWRHIGRKRIGQYLLLWGLGTLGLIVLVLLLWADGLLNLALMSLLDLLPLDAHRLRNLLILVALLVIPFARIGLAPAALTKNRHR